MMNAGSSSAFSTTSIAPALSRRGSMATHGGNDKDLGAQTLKGTHGRPGKFADMVDP
jgi:hypothetical protein